MAAGCCPLAAGCWPLAAAVGCWLLAARCPMPCAMRRLLLSHAAYATWPAFTSVVISYVLESFFNTFASSCMSFAYNLYDRGRYFLSWCTNSKGLDFGSDDQNRGPSILFVLSWWTNSKGLDFGSDDQNRGPSILFQVSKIEASQSLSSMQCND